MFRNQYNVGQVQISFACFLTNLQKEVQWLE